MIWSKERPTVTGHYWYADHHYPAPIMVFVSCYGFEDQVYYFSGAKVSLSAHKGYWYFVSAPAMICKRDKMVNV